MADERRAGRIAVARDHVDDARREARLDDELRELSVDVGVTSDGFTTTVLPAASAGKSFQPSSPSGVFQGVIAATTPIGSRTV